MKNMKKLFLSLLLLTFVFGIASVSAYHYDDSWKHTSYKESSPYHSFSESKTKIGGYNSYTYKSEEYYPYKYNALHNYWKYGPSHHYYNAVEYKKVEYDAPKHHYPKYHDSGKYYQPKMSGQYYPIPPYYYGPKGSMLKPEYDYPSYAEKTYNQKYLPVYW